MCSMVCFGRSRKHILILLLLLRCRGSGYQMGARRAATGRWLRRPPAFQTSRRSMRQKSPTRVWAGLTFREGRRQVVCHPCRKGWEVFALFCVISLKFRFICTKCFNFALERKKGFDSEAAKQDFLARADAHKQHHKVLAKSTLRLPLHTRMFDIGCAHPQGFPTKLV